MQEPHRTILNFFMIIAAAGSVISLLKIFFDDTPIFYFFTGITIGILLTIMLSELLDRLYTKDIDERFD